jgi:RNA polymerase sigma-70 factor, ECF subfamily
MGPPHKGRPLFLWDVAGCKAFIATVHNGSAMPMSFSRGSSESPRRDQAPLGRSMDPAPTMGPQEFGSRFRDASRIMWLIAVGIVGDASEAEDVVQDAAVVAYRKRHQFQAGTSFRAWVGAIVRNVALNVKRSRKRRRGAMNGFAESGASHVYGSGVQDAVHAIERGLDARVLLALAEIGDIARACLLLRTVGDLHYSEIASVLEIPEGTAMSHVHRSRAILRERLAPVWREQIGADRLETKM